MDSGGVIVLLSILALSAANPFVFAPKQSGDGDKTYTYDLAMCESQCVKQVTQVVQQTCGDDVTCVKTAGGVGGRLCSLACRGKDVLENLAHESTPGPTPKPKPDVVSCILGCVGDFLTKWDEFMKKCGKDWQCWVQAVAMEGMRCGLNCMPRLENQAMESGPLNQNVIEVSERDIACWTGCLKETAINKIEETILKCNIHPWCYVAVFGMDAAQCIARCLPHKEAEVLLVTGELIKFIPSKPLITEAETEVAVSGDYVKCWAKCLGKSVEEVEEWVKKCHTDIKCWLKVAGFDAIKCAAECIKLDSREENLEPGVGAREPETELTVSEPYVECWAHCLGKSIDVVAKWVAKCKLNVKCWIKVAGFKAAKCAAKCIKKGASQAEIPTPVTLKPGVREVAISDPYVECWAKCLGQSIEQVEQWVEKCHTDVKCWLKVAGFDAIKCAAKCIKLEDIKCWLKVAGFDAIKCAAECIKLDSREENLEPGVGAREPETELTVSEPYVECWAHCLGKSIDVVAKWAAKCKLNVKCWIKVAGFKAAKCAVKCIKKEASQAEIPAPVTLKPEVREVAISDPYVECWAKCLGQSIEQVEQWVEKCHTDVKCWLKVAGFDAIKCAAKCIKLEASQAEIPAPVTLKPEVREVAISDPYVECWAKCLGQSIEQVEQWVEKCHTDVKCWLKVAGFDAIKCAAKCIKLEDAEESHTVAIIRVVNFVQLRGQNGHFGGMTSSFVKCWAKCLGKSVEEVEEWVKKCHKDIKCWIEVAGMDALKCAAECIKSDTNQFQYLR